MPSQYVRYVMIDPNDEDVRFEDSSPLDDVGVLHSSLRKALYYEGPYLKTNPQAFIAKVTFERVLAQPKRRRSRELSR